MLHFASKAQVFERSKFNFIVADCERAEMRLNKYRWVEALGHTLAILAKE